MLSTRFAMCRKCRLEAAFRDVNDCGGLVVEHASALRYRRRYGERKLPRAVDVGAGAASPAKGRRTGALLRLREQSGWRGLRFAEAGAVSGGLQSESRVGESVWAWRHGSSGGCRVDSREAVQAAPCRIAVHARAGGGSGVDDAITLLTPEMDVSAEACSRGRAWASLCGLGGTEVAVAVEST
jgi:hypothetical protein